MSEKEIIECAGVGSLSASSDRTSGFEFIVAAIHANTTNRYVQADFFLNGTFLGSISAADMALAGAISSQHQMFTLPVGPGDNWKVQWNVANHNGEVKLWRIA